MALKDTSIPKTLKFLILDDIDTMRVEITNQLKQFGFTGPFYEASTIKEAKAVLIKEPVDFIFADWNLKNETGFQFLEEVRKIGKFDKIPFIMITTEDGVGNILDAIRAGASNYIIKPWQADDFEEKLTYAWQKIFQKKT